ncbi:hypothetical protein DAEQUDRAFT_333776 [Daedalea quercina L-15889]|uniref:Uncharacterized protein n=1 Tax=Daedalea quercina L-15889 TaxID=1314783 RepID=A0A165PMS6_9APHY|nr:hypothetical protein DAEQUDRAFT_333776 [Daedalea quercina L-15889]
MTCTPSMCLISRYLAGLLSPQRKASAPAAVVRLTDSEGRDSAKIQQHSRPARSYTKPADKVTVSVASYCLLPCSVLRSLVSWCHSLSVLTRPTLWLCVCPVCQSGFVPLRFVC